MEGLAKDKWEKEGSCWETWKRKGEASSFGLVELEHERVLCEWAFSAMRLISSRFLPK